MIAFAGADVFDGRTTHRGCVLVVEEGRVAAVLPRDEAPTNARVERLEGGLLAPGFVDLQVNGGGGVLLNDEPTPEGMAAIARAHARFGTTGLLPTLITDEPHVMASALAAGREADDIPGVLGLHLEGPFIARTRKGAHREDFIRPPDESDLAALLAHGLPRLMVTLAPEIVPPADVERLANAGILVSLGHSDADYDTAAAAAKAGARAVTHLFNAMSPLSHRAPGLVGAALDCAGLSLGLIADGHHVHPAALRTAIRAKGSEAVFLVTDAMSSVGATARSFELHGRTVTRENGRLTLGDGTLAGSDLDMGAAVRFAVEIVGMAREEALRMASLYPARLLNLGDCGRLAPGSRADIVHLDDALAPLATWIAGRRAA